ncbi:MAG TPA: PfkB family carbohydrate kinase [Holophaga sp.]|nr:PfkB family carbohydrate kinase [Holophaga sp.]HPS68632.1 PfkB family carbohydrate kinase [Holophaga sp.]
MSLLAVGSVSFDDIETPFGRQENALGGSVSYVALSACHFHPVQVAGVVGEDFGPQQERIFEGRPIDLRGLARRPGKSSRWKGSYGYELSEATTLDRQPNVSLDFHPVLPEAYRSASYLYLGKLDPVEQLDVVGQMIQRPRWIALETAACWIEGSREALGRVLREADMLLVDEREARALAGEHNLLKIYRKVQAMGPRILVVKLGEHGAMLLAPEGVFASPAYPLEDVFDPTGAEDAFAGGFLGCLASRKSTEVEALKHATLTGIIMASFAVERFGTQSLEFVTEHDIKRRMRAFSDMTRIDGL